MADHMIRIDLDQQGNLVYHPAVQPANKKNNDRVGWRYHGDFRITFLHGTPFGWVTRQAHEVIPPEPFREDATPGVYHYSVAVLAAREGRERTEIIVDMGSPEIIVESF